MFLLIYTGIFFFYYCGFQVPVTDGGVFRVVTKENKFVDKVKYEVKEGSFVFYHEMPSAGKKQCISEAFPYSKEGRIVANTQSLQLTIEFDKDLLMISTLRQWLRYTTVFQLMVQPIFWNWNIIQPIPLYKLAKA